MQGEGAGSTPRPCRLGQPCCVAFIHSFPCLSLSLLPETPALTPAQTTNLSPAGAEDTRYKLSPWCSEAQGVCAPESRRQDLVSGVCWWGDPKGLLQLGDKPVRAAEGQLQVMPRGRHPPGTIPGYHGLLYPSEPLPNSLHLCSR